MTAYTSERRANFVALAKTIENINSSISRHPNLPADFSIAAAQIEAAALQLLQGITTPNRELLNAAMSANSIPLLSALPDAQTQVDGYYPFEAEDVHSAEILEIAMRKGLSLGRSTDKILEAAPTRPDLQEFLLKNIKAGPPPISKLFDAGQMPYADCPDFSSAYIRLIASTYPDQLSQRLMVGLASPVCGKTVALCLLAGAAFDFDRIGKHVMVDNAVAQEMSSNHVRMGLLAYTPSLEVACADAKAFAKAADYIESIALRAGGS
jgi:hypothetical protein